MLWTLLRIDISVIDETDIVSWSNAICMPLLVVIVLTLLALVVQILSFSLRADAIISIGGKRPTWTLSGAPLAGYEKASGLNTV